MYATGQWDSGTEVKFQRWNCLQGFKWNGICYWTEFHAKKGSDLKLRISLTDVLKHNAVQWWEAQLLRHLLSSGGKQPTAVIQEKPNRRNLPMWKMNTGAHEHLLKISDMTWTILLSLYQSHFQGPNFPRGYFMKNISNEAEPTVGTGESFPSSVFWGDIFMTSAVLEELGVFWVHKVDSANYIITNKCQLWLNVIYYSKIGYFPSVGPVVQDSGDRYGNRIKATVLINQ